MKVVIDIDDETYETIKNAEPLKWDCPIESAYKAIKNGTPLSKSRGRLIILSEDTLKREQTSLSFSCQNWISEVGLSNATVATIEADKEDKECKTYCTECPYFNDIIYEGEQWYGARCKKDGHSTKPSMYAIKSLNDDCPLTKDKEDK